MKRRRSRNSYRSSNRVRRSQRSPYGTIDRRSRNRKRAIRKRRLTLLGIFVVLFALIWGGFYLYARHYVSGQGSQLIYQNIYIDEVKVAGLSKEEAKKQLDSYLAELGKQELTLILEKETMPVTLKELGLSMTNEDALVEEAMAYGKTGGVFSRYSKLKDLREEKIVLKAEYAIDEEQTKTVLEEKMSKVNKGTVDATIERKNGVFEITDEVVGITVDMEKSQGVLNSYFKGDWKKQEGTISLVATTDKPKVTREDLEKIQDVLGTYTTTCGYGGGRVQNIETGAKKMNGTLLMPGEEFSADGAMRPYTKENGFAEAGSYENGKVVQSMGGGICQVSSTLYNAVLLAELEVTQRAPHSMLVTYVEPAMDAAIAGDYKDLKFKNSSDAPIYLEGYVSGGKITFTIYGAESRDASRRIEYVSETLETKKPDPKYQASNDALGTIKLVTSAHIGKTAKLWKVVYEDGKEVSREVVNTSKYSSSSAVYSVGTKTDNANAAKLVTDAIKTQKEKKVKAAVAEAKALVKAEKNQKTEDPKQDTKVDTEPKADDKKTDTEE